MKNKMLHNSKLTIETAFVNQVNQWDHGNNIGKTILKIK